MAALTDQQTIDQRRKYVEAWNNTMVDIWQEQITKLGVFDTGALYDSAIAMPVRADGRFYEITLRFQFLLYGLFQDFGSVERGIERRPWYSSRYYSSVIRLRDFLADSIGQEFCGIITREFDRKATP